MEIWCVVFAYNIPLKYVDQCFSWFFKTVLILVRYVYYVYKN